MKWEQIETLAVLASVAILAGLGRHLASEEPKPVKHIIGHALMNGVLGIAAAATLLFFADLPTLALVGIAAVFGTVGTEGVIWFAKRFVEKKL